jgi:hypothetical protein
MATTSARRAALTAVALIVLAGLFVRRASTPPEPVPATAPAVEFSAERALTHVREIAQRPHPAGSPENARIRAYLVQQLRALGLEVEVQEATGVGTRYPAAGRIANVLARLPGRNPGELAVVLMSHYDGVGGGPAAGDAGAGTAAIIETLRALRAGPPLAHDVLAVITDGEEAGLLGAAAFVREHPWAKRIGVVMNFEARGTTGRASMFETGAGNLDVVRVLRTAGDVSSTSLSVTVYRSLPNDTDLSEIAALGKPALNFAFVDGVERYHTAHDDVGHLDLGSLQHHGSQMLSLARSFGNGPLPRPATGDAVFFDLPLLGLIVYPERWAWPVALVAVLAVMAALIRVARREPRWIRDMLLGTVATIVSAAIAGTLATIAATSIQRTHDAMGWGGAPAFRGVYSAALAALALVIVLGSWAVIRRWTSVAGANAGALIVWTVVTLVVTWKLPGVSFMFVWALIAMAIAAAVAARPQTYAERAGRGVGAGVLLWAATLVAMAIVVPIVYSVSAVSLGAVGPGGTAAGILVALLAWLLSPHVDAMTAGRPWRTTAIAFALTTSLFGVGMATVRRSPAHPMPSQIVYAVNADDQDDAWLAARGPNRTQVAPDSLVTSPPAWVSRVVGGGDVSLRKVARVAIDGPTVDVISDSTVGDERTLALRVRPSSGTQVIAMRTIDQRVTRARVDGRPIDTSRYRRGASAWSLNYTAPPDSGFRLDLTVPAAASVSLELRAQVRGVPTLPGIELPPRALDVVTVQAGDHTVVRRTVILGNQRP